MTITVYSIPHCPQCKATEDKLTQLGHEYQKINVAEDKESLEHVLSLGYKQAPVVEVKNGEDVLHWYGYRPDRIKSL